jgi:hypothetical protein
MPRQTAVAKRVVADVAVDSRFGTAARTAKDAKRRRQDKLGGLGVGLGVPGGKRADVPVPATT